MTEAEAAENIKEAIREDLGKGTRGKYALSYAEAHHIVLLEPKVAKAFPNEKAVNEALMSLIKLARASTGLTKDSSERS